MIKIIIPNSVVTKIIGAKGCMIRELAFKSGGARIKILAKKYHTESECCLTIEGELEYKVNATKLIIELNEIFKYGGPTLLSGKTINSNLAE